MATNHSQKTNHQSSNQNSSNNSNDKADPQSTENGSSWLGFWKTSSARSPSTDDLQTDNIDTTTTTTTTNPTTATISTPSPSPTITKETAMTSETQGNDTDATHNTDITSTENNQQQQQQQQQQQHDDDKDEGNNKTDNNTIHQQTGLSSPGLWSWLGYSSGAVTNNDNANRVSTPPSNDNISKSGNEDDDTNQNNISSTSTPSDNSELPPPPPPAPVIPSKSSWHSYFFSTNTTRPPSIDENDAIPENSSNNDSVIIEPTTSTQDDLLNNNPPSTPPPSIKQWTNGDNVVLPSIKSQFAPPPPLPPQTLFTKALNAISTIFSQSSGAGHQRHHQDLVAKIIKEMKAHPENVAGKKIVIIGVHGWFPTKLVRSVVGEPTGTSTKFCEQTAKAVRQYFEQEHDLVLPLECMTLIPLQWEGKVQERVEKLYSFLVDNPAFLNALQSADVIFWTTHSQGTPVSAILMDRLIQENIIRHKSQAVCLLAMAGIAHGPFASLKGSLIVKYFEADAARELFDFMDPSSDISQAFRQAMASILQQGIKTILVGSMQDQVVPLYSAIMVATDHPNILRAIYIDGHIYSPDDFLINLILFALRIRNAGLSDHGLLLHISDVLAGNLYAWEGGHSTIYEETSVYSLAPQYLFDTHPLGGLLPMHQEHPNTSGSPSTVVEAKSSLFKAKVRLNPYYLTWAMRGIFDDIRVTQVFGDELDRLRVLFDQWHPTSSKLREIKLRLEPIKARL